MKTELKTLLNFARIQRDKYDKIGVEIRRNSKNITSYSKKYEQYKQGLAFGKSAGFAIIADEIHSLLSETERNNHE